MAYKKIEEYKGKQAEFPYPSDNIDPKLKKEKEWYLSIMQAVMADYSSNACMIPFEFGNQRPISVLRQYAKGKQSSGKIKEWILGKKNQKKDGTFVTKMNVSWETYAKLPQMFDIMRAKNMSQEYGVDMRCVDDKSIAAIQATRDMMKYLIDENTKDFLENAIYKPNFEPNPELLGLQNEDDVDMYIDTGGFTLQWQMAAIAACNKTKIVSNYKEFQDLSFDDLIINPEGITGGRTYIEKSTRLPKFRHVNMERAIVPYFEGIDSKDKITRAGEIRVMTIADVRRENPDLSAPQLLQLAKDFQWMNPQYASLIQADGYYGSNQYSNQYYDIDPVSRVKLLVLDIQWLSTDIETNLKNERSGVFKEVDFDLKLDKKAKMSGDKIVKKKVIRKYEAQWIIGTEHFLNRGVCDDQIYYGEDGNKTPSLDYHFVKTGNMSLIERCIAIVDEMDMIMMKHRNAWATLPAAPAMAIQQDLLENVFLNGIKQQPEDVIQAFIERGILFYNGLDDHGKPMYMAGGQKPIDYMDVTKMAGMLAICSNELQVKVNSLREVLGLQGGTDGGARSPYQGLGETQLAFEASNSSLAPTFNAYRYLFKNIFNDIIRKWQIVAREKPIKIGYSQLGAHNMKMLELGKNFTAADFNAEVVIASTIEERQAILADIVNLRSIGVQTGGQQGITHAQYLYLHEKVMAGNIKEAYFVLSKIEARRFAEAKRDKEADMQANIQSQQQSARLKGEEDRASIQAKGDVQNTNTILAGLLKQNQALIEQLIKPTKEGESRSNEGLAMATIDSNTNDIAQLLDPEQELPVEQMQEEEMIDTGNMPLM